MPYKLKRNTGILDKGAVFKNKVPAVKMMKDLFEEIPAYEYERRIHKLKVKKLGWIDQLNSMIEYMGEEEAGK